MKLYIALLTAATFSFSSLFIDYDYEKAWKEVEKHLSKGLPKSALNKVDEIYEMAYKEKNVNQQVKSTNYRTSLILNTEELGLEKVISDLESRIEKATIPAKNILQSMTAELISNYFNQNYYLFRDRTDLGESTKDIRTWSPNNYRSYISELYLGSLEGNVKTSNSEDYRVLITNEKTANFELRPTLYSLLLDRAMNYFSNNHLDGNDAVNRFTLQGQDNFSEVEKFVLIDIPTDNEEAFAYRKLKMYQDALLHGIEREEEELIASYNLSRLQFVYNQLIINNKDSLYVEALSRAESNAKLVIAKEKYGIAIVLNLLGLQKYDASMSKIELVRRYASKNGLLQLSNIEGQIKQPNFNFHGREVYSSKDALTFSISSKNLKDINFKVVKIDLEEYNDERGHEKQMDYLKGLKSIESWKVDLENRYKETTKIVEYKEFSYGNYALIGKKNGSYDAMIFHVSDLAYSYINSNNSDYLLVRDRITGDKVENVKIDFYTREYRNRKNVKDFVKSGYTDRDGKVIISDNENRQYNVVVSKGKDVLDLNTYVYSNNTYRNNKNGKVEIFTDRSIYRPGQTVYFKGVAMTFDEDDIPRLITEGRMSVSLNDANNQDVSDLELMINEFGSVSGSFTLPIGGLTGNYRISMATDGAYGTKAISVEEYKRPTFEVNIERNKEKIYLNEEVIARGNATYYSGASVADAKYTYKVYRSSYPSWGRSYYYFRRPAEKVMIKEGNGVSEKDGSFSIPFISETDGSKGRFTFSVEIYVTDGNGETRQGETSISLSTVPYNYMISGLSDHDVVDKNNVVIKAQNANGEPVESTSVVKISILDEIDISEHYRLLKENHRYDSDEYVGGKKERKGRVLEEITVDISKEGYIMDIDNLKAGSYEISIESSENYDGETITTHSTFVITDFKKKDFPSDKILYLSGHNGTYKINKEVKIDLGVSDGPIWVYYMWINDNDIVKEGWTKVDDKAILKYVPKLSDKGGISLSVSYVKNNTSFGENFNINIPWDDKKLDVKLETMRDVTFPGSKEKWKLKFISPEKDQILAEMVASMYDVSLDHYKDHNYTFNPFSSHYGSINNNLYGFRITHGRHFNYQWNQIDYNVVEQKQIPSLLGYQFYNNNSVRNRMYNSRSIEMDMRSKSSGNESDMILDGVQVARGQTPSASQDMEYAEVEEGSISNSSREEVKMANSESGGKKYQEFSLRENLNETVFFYPHIKVKGNEVDLEFTMNEALTTWKLMTFTHDKELRYGLASAEVKTQKDVMILPNGPRFFREGDMIVFPATIFNLSDKVLEIELGIELTDALEDKKLNQIFGVSQQKKVTIGAGESKKVSWKIHVPVSYKDVVKYKVWARSGDHTDGQANILPVITNQKLLTETKIVSLRSDEEKTLDIGSMGTPSDTHIPFLMTLEYTSNPTWYAVQALPFVMDDNHKNAISIFNRYYANALSSHIANGNPKIKQIFDVWKAKGSDALISNLDKNEELKYALMEETPWVRDAQSEAEQKHRIGVLFDLNNIAAGLKYAINEITQHQNSDGGFSWYPGGRSSVYITQYIVEGIGHLDRLEVRDKNELSGLLNRAIDYMDIQTAERYRLLKENIKRNGGSLTDDHIDRTSIQYLYTRKYFTNKVPSGTKEAYEYYFGQSKKYWLGKGLQLEAMIALYLLEAKDEKYYDIVASLTERSFYSEELGRYWNQGNGFNWYDLPIETHSIMIELFNEVGTEARFVEDAKIWLLKNKQTNHWKTGKSTASAIYAILLDNGITNAGVWLDAENLPEIKVNDHPLVIENAEVGTGYIKERWTQEEMKEDRPRTIEIENNSETIGWGAVYYQYFEDLDKITSHSDNPLSVVKTLYKEATDGDGTKLIKIGVGEKLKKGDRIITRIEIKTDRSMDYVQLKDMRPSGFEPENILSGYQWKGEFGYYESTRDLASHFFMDHLRKGTFIFEYPSRVVHAGSYSSGIATIQCMYAPEFTSYSEGFKLEIKE